MKYLPKFIFMGSLLALMPVLAQAAGTYYSGGTYRSPQTGYNTQSYAQRANNGYAGGNYASSYSSTRPRVGLSSAQQQWQQPQNVRATNTKTTQNSSASRNGFWLDAGFTHEMAQWEFEMKENASILHYNNIGWNVLDVKAGYAFDMGSVRGQIDAGFKYGMQSGESNMVDDDVTRGGYLVTSWCEDVDANGNCIGFIGDQIGHALSVGTSDGGNMLGFNVGFGLTDVFQLGGVRITPSVGYRYLKYKLETKKNYGLAVDSANCVEINGEIQCDPAIVILYNNNSQQIIWGPTDTNNDGFWDIGSGAVGVYPEGTYYFQQPGVSHSYEVEWSGPYLALDMDYMINANNSVNGRIELGLPGYTATGDQPYRFDWAHPKSVEDEAGMFGAFHFGMGANWLTAISNTVSLSIGLTYDYYSVDGADASTYLNEDYYMGMYDEILTAWQNAGRTESEMLGQVEGVNGDPTAIGIKEIQDACPGWVCKVGGEIESFYKSIGIRVGINAQF